MDCTSEEEFEKSEFCEKYRFEKKNGKIKKMVLYRMKVDILRLYGHG